MTQLFTGVGVESTARQACESGFKVTLALDAMTGMSAQAHENSMLRIFSRLGETGITAEIIALLDRRENGLAVFHRGLPHRKAGDGTDVRFPDDG